MKNLLLISFFTLLLGSFSNVYGQEYKLKKLKMKTAENEHKEIYHIRKIVDSEDEIKEGPYESWYKKVKISEGQYKNNLRTGLWNFYSYLGDLSYQGTYIEGRMDGLWEYELHGKKSAEVYFTNDIMDSTFGFYPNGQKSYEVKYYEDQSGICISYYENGQMHEYIPLKEKKIHGLTTIFFYNGLVHKQLIYDKSRPEKLVSCYDFNGNIIYGGNLENGNGEYVQYYLPHEEGDDSLRVYSLENYQDYFLNGQASYIYRNGNPKTQGVYVNGIKKGKWDVYEESGSFKNTEEHKVSSSLLYLSDGTKFPYYIDRSLSRLVVAKFQDIEIPELSFEFEEADLTYEKDFEKKCRWFLKRNRRANESRFYSYNSYVLNSGSHSDLIQHDVYIKSRFNEDGEITNISSNKGNKELINESNRVLMLMPHFSPALYLGVPVPMNSEFHFIYIMQNSSTSNIRESLRMNGNFNLQNR